MYNSEATVTTCIRSVLNQTYKCEIEIIVVNDGSTDDSVAIVEEIIKTNNTKIVIQLINKENRGVSTARNIGMKIAKGEWIALLDSDDEWMPNKLERQMQILINNANIDFLGTSRNGECYSFFWKNINGLTKISCKMILVKNFFSPPTIIFKKQIFLEIGGFDENQRYYEEGNYFVRISQKYNCYLLNESLVITGGGKPYFGHSGLSGNLKEMERGELKNIRDALNLGVINLFEYLFLVVYSFLKYIRRVLIVKFR